MKTSNPYGFKFFGGLFVLVSGAITLYFASLANGPDYNLKFVREVASDADPKALDRQFVNLGHWPQWFYSLDQVEVLTPSGSVALNEHELRSGELLRMQMNPKKGLRKKFQIFARVEEYIPFKKLRLRIVDDSTDRLTRLFDLLEWQLEVLPDNAGSQKTLIRGTAIAHTAHWKSRLFGKITEKILMNQIFYPDLIKLADVKRPFLVSPIPPDQS